MRERQFTDCVDIVGASCKPFEGNRRYISTGAVATDHIDESDVEIVDYKSRPSRADLIVEPGTLLFAKMQGTKKTLYVDKEKAENIYSTGFFALKAKSGVISTRCLYHMLGSTSFLTQKDKNCSGATQKAITNAGLKKIRVSIPDYQLQEAIADQLDKISSVIQMRRSELQKLDDLVKARFVEMFGDPENNSFDWKEQPLSKHLDVVGGFAFKSDQFVEEGIPVLRIGNINAGYFKPVNMVFWDNDDNLKKYKLFPGDLVMSLTGTVGKDDYGNVCILGNDYDEYYLNQRNAKLELKDSINKYYISTLLKFESIKKKLTGISRGIRQANISNKDILNLVVPIPNITTQIEFEQFVQQIDKSKFVVQQALDKAQLLFDSLMQQYFG